MLKTIAAIAALGLATPALLECPDDIVRHEKARITYGRDIDCGTLSFQHQGIRLGGPNIGCPAFVLVIPPRDMPSKSPGSQTYVIPAGNVAVTLLTFSCSTEWFLFIPLSSSCVLNESKVVGQLITYQQLPCDIDSQGSTVR